MIHRILISLFFIIQLLSCGSQQQISRQGGGQDKENVQVGKVLPAWQEGNLDIHAINTGRGEATFFIFPDGTTMLIDAAGSLISSTAEIPPPPQKPDSTVSPGTVIINYAKHFMTGANNKQLDYVMLSHFDPDHMGSYGAGLPAGPDGSFRMSGVTEVGSKIQFKRLIDRGYPHYDFPRKMAQEPRMANYIDFINWAKKEYGATAEQFVVGRNDQIVLTRQASQYPRFKVQNLVANGVVWTGSGTNTVNTLPDGPTVQAAGALENVYCIGLDIAYGKFNYFTAGDLQYNGKSDHPWKDIEAPVAKVARAVDVMKANHHGTSNCNGSDLIKQLNPQAVIAHTWRDVHPNPETVGRMFSANENCQIFSTNMTDANKRRMGDALQRLKGLQGHVVVRVKPGGEQYNIYVLDDSNQEYNVVGIFGPYQSR